MSSPSLHWTVSPRWHEAMLSPPCAFTVSEGRGTALLLSGGSDNTVIAAVARDLGVPLRTFPSPCVKQSFRISLWQAIAHALRRLHGCSVMTIRRYLQNQIFLMRPKLVSIALRRQQLRSYGLSPWRRTRPDLHERAATQSTRMRSKGRRWLLRYCSSP